MYVIKAKPEDFLVQEIPDRHWRDIGAYLVLEVVKRERNTEDVAQQLAQQVRRPRHDVAYAGLKDKHAVTKQYFSVKNAKQNVLDWISIPGVTCKVVGYTDEPLSLGSLKGNHFRITVRNIKQAPSSVALVPNFFDEQRFSEHNDEIGKSLVKGDFQRACTLIDDERLRESLRQQPNDFVGALRRLPKKLLTLYVHAYQSRLFNAILEQQLNDSSLEELRSVYLPLVGFGTTETEIYDDILVQEGVTTRDFIVRELPDVSSEGGERRAVVEVSDLVISPLEEDELHEGMKKCVVSFSLPKGAYATNVIKWLCS